MMIDPDKHRKLVNFAMEHCLSIPRRKKHCSIIVAKKKIISVGTNRYKTHPLAAKHGYLFDEVHSELDALLKCDKKCGIELWNFRFNANGEMRMSRPCPKCLPWCLKIFDRIVYTMDDGMHEFDMSVLD
jgi:deoxycytidylate deaminase